MRNVPAVSPVRGTPFDVDLLIGSLGFEARSRVLPLLYASESRCRIRLASFESQRVLSFEENRARLAAAGLLVDEVCEADFGEWLSRAMPVAEHRPLRVVVDVSSMSRYRIAECVRFGCEYQMPLEMVFLYQPAQFRHTQRGPSTIKSLAPVSRYFAGLSVDPELPLSLLMGLGYEADRALGVVEFLEPATVYCLFPRGGQDYEDSIEAANRDLVDSAPLGRVVNYEFGDPLASFVMLNSMVAGLRRYSRVSIVPFGPKIFSVISLLVSSLYGDVTVWRASDGDDVAPVDRVADPSRAVVGLSASWFSSEGRSRT